MGKVPAAGVSCALLLAAGWLACAQESPAGWKVVTAPTRFQGPGFVAGTLDRSARHGSREVLLAWEPAPPDRWGNAPRAHVLVFTKDPQLDPFEVSSATTRAWFELRGGDHQAPFVLVCGPAAGQLLDRNGHERGWARAFLFAEYPGERRVPHGFTSVETYRPGSELSPGCIRVPQDYAWDAVR